MSMEIAFRRTLDKLFHIFHQFRNTPQTTTNIAFYWFLQHPKHKEGVMITPSYGVLLETSMILEKK
jgi:hypothetical protein